MIKDVRETIENEAKQQKGGFLGMPLDTLGASLLRNLLTGKSTIRACSLYVFQVVCISISAFDSLLGIPTGIKSSPIGLKACSITEVIKKCKSIIKKKKKKHDKIVLLEKCKFNRIEVLISKALIDSNEVVLINNMLKEYGNIKEEIKNKVKS